MLILSGDQLYRMDFRELMRTHRESNADITVAAIPVPETDTPGFGLLSMTDAGRVTGFVEKPKTAEERAPYFTAEEWIERRGIPCNGRHYLANMGIYVFNTDVLIETLTAKPLATDFGKEVFPRNYKTKKVQAHLFDGYWEDLGTVRSYHESSLALASSNPPFDFFAREGVIYTRMRNLPASRITGAALTETMISDGCVVQAGSKLERALLGVPLPHRQGLPDPGRGDHRVGLLRDRRGPGGERRGRPAGPERGRRGGGGDGHPGQGLPHRPGGADREQGQPPGGGRP